MGEHPFAGTPQYDQQYGANAVGRVGNGLGLVNGRWPNGVGEARRPLRPIFQPAQEWPEVVSLDDFRQGRPLIDLERISPDEIAA